MGTRVGHYTSGRLNWACLGHAKAANEAQTWICTTVIGSRLDHSLPQLDKSFMTLRLDIPRNSTNGKFATGFLICVESMRIRNHNLCILDSNTSLRITMSL